MKNFYSPRARHKQQCETRALSGTQSGFVLIVALIVLGAMALAAVALVKTVDMSTLLARNISFKRDALNRTEIAQQVALSKFLVGGPFVANGTTESNVPSENFSAILLPTDVRGIPNVMLATNTFPISGQFNIDPSSLPAESKSEGNSTIYVIERMCSAMGPPDKNSCQKNPPSNAVPPPPTPAFYRVTARTTGPRNAIAYSQTIIVPQTLVAP